MALRSFYSFLNEDHVERVPLRDLSPGDRVVLPSNNKVGTVVLHTTIGGVGPNLQHQIKVQYDNGVKVWYSADPDSLLKRLPTAVPFS